MNSIGVNDLNHLQDFVNTLFLRLRGRRRKYTIIDIFAAAAAADAAADGFIRTRFCFFRYALAHLSRVHLFLAEEWQQSIYAARQTACMQQKNTHRMNWTKARNFVVKVRSFQFMHYYYQYMVPKYALGRFIV